MVEPSWTGRSRWVAGARGLYVYVCVWHPTSDTLPAAAPRVQEGRGSLWEVWAARAQSGLEEWITRSVRPWTQGQPLALEAPGRPPAFLGPLLRWTAAAAVLGAALLLGLRAAGLGGSAPRPAQLPAVVAVSGAAGPAVVVEEEEVDVVVAGPAHRQGVAEGTEGEQQPRRRWWQRSRKQPPQQESAEQQATVAAAAGSSRASKALAPLSKQQAQAAVRRWLSVKADALGPRHVTAELEHVLASPMLEVVAEEAEQVGGVGVQCTTTTLWARAGGTA